MLIAFSSVPQLDVQLPRGDGNISLLHLYISIRDRLDCIAEVNLTSVIVTADSSRISLLMDAIQYSFDALSTNAIVQSLSSGNQNTVGQILTSLAQQFNQINAQSLNNAVSNGVPASTIFVSSLSTQRSPTVESAPLNRSTLTDYEQKLNSYANVRDYLMQFTMNLLITTSQSIILQASTLAQLTSATNQLTRAATVKHFSYRLCESVHWNENR